MNFNPSEIYVRSSLRNPFRTPCTVVLKESFQNSMSDRPSGILFIPLYSLNVILHGFLCLRGYHGVSGIRLVGNVFADDKMHAGSFFLHAGRPDISAVILDDLADDGEADPAPSTGGIAGGIGAVKAISCADAGRNEIIQMINTKGFIVVSL